jgi:mono/diheme cytochrome c family protein
MGGVEREERAMNRVAILGGAVAVVVLAGYLAPGPAVPVIGTATEGDAIVQVVVPAALSEVALIGQRVFEDRCAACHGENASGRNGVGPPLVHKIYEPSHHGDAAFLLAARNGVRAHHWTFGNMPPVDGITDAEIAHVTRYVRELQEANGIF